MKYFEDCYIKVFEEKNMLQNGGTLYRVPKGKNYNFEYILFIPNGIVKKTSIILEGMNYRAGITNDPNRKIEDMYNGFITFKNSIHYCNSKSCFPIIYPLIPRYYDDTLNEEIYTNMLSSNSFKVVNKKYECVDLQIINMIEDAKDRLRKNGFTIDDKIIIDGFSGSAKFGNRFTLLHPELVKLCICGGLGGCLTLPIKSIDNKSLLYPVGIGNIDITEDKIKLFKSVKQFYYQGLKDKVDAFKAKGYFCFEPCNSGIIKKDELKQLYKYLGRNIKKRWKNTQKYYKEIGVNAKLISYKNGVHSRALSNDYIKELLESEIDSSK